jgi:hypothetical protein
MDLKDTAKQIRQVLILLLEGGFKMPIILTSVDRYGSVMLAEYTPVSGRKDHWDCEIIAARMKSELSLNRPLICSSLARGAKRLGLCSTPRESGELWIRIRPKSVTPARLTVGYAYAANPSLAVICEQGSPCDEIFNHNSRLPLC